MGADQRRRVPALTARPYDRRMPAISPTARNWIGGLVTTAAVLGALALAGGFAPASSQPGRQIAPGETISLTRWDVSVDACSYLPPYDDQTDSFGRVELTMTVTNTWSQSLPYMEKETYAVNLPNGDALAGANGEWMTFIGIEGTGGFDPGFTRTAVVRGDLLSEYWGTDEPVLVRLASERPSDSYLNSDSWTADRQEAFIYLPCPEVLP